MKLSKQEFDKYFEKRIELTYSVLSGKQKEYGDGEKDILHNFNTGATIANLTREEVLDGFMLKHYISYRDIVNNISKGTLPSEELLEEKVGDMINYLILFEASVKQKINNNKLKQINTNERETTNDSRVFGETISRSKSSGCNSCES
jgi:hypothetical protein